MSNIRNLSYELYKRDWINSHMTKEMELDSMRDYALDQLEQPKYNQGYKSFEEWTEDNGYSKDELYVCFDEFCRAEYLDETYMESLLDNTELIEAYKKDLSVRNLWLEFGDVPMDPETECIEEEWNDFPAGTHREEIWIWFEETFNISVAMDLM